MTDTTPILPCPFCGADAQYEPGGEWQFYDTWAVECVGCGAQINGSTDMRVSGTTAKAEALTAWNTRANADARLVEALVAARAMLSIYDGVQSRVGDAFKIIDAALSEVSHGH